MSRQDTASMLAAQAQEYLDQEHDSEKLAALPTDYARYEYCWKRAVHFRNALLDGQRNYVASVLASTHARYEHVSRRERIVQAKITWFTSAEAKDLLEMEQDWFRWSQGYLARWQGGALMQIVRHLDTLVGELRASGR